MPPHLKNLGWDPVAGDGSTDQQRLLTRWEFALKNNQDAPCDPKIAGVFEGALAFLLSDRGRVNAATQALPMRSHAVFKRSFKSPVLDRICAVTFVSAFNCKKSIATYVVTFRSTPTILVSNGPSWA